MILYMLQSKKFNFMLSLIEIRAIKEVAVASITEQLATGVFIKIGHDYLLFHKTNKGEITVSWTAFPLK